WLALAVKFSFYEAGAANRNRFSRPFRRGTAARGLGRLYDQWCSAGVFDFVRKAHFRAFGDRAEVVMYVREACDGQWALRLHIWCQFGILPCHQVVDKIFKDLFVFVQTEGKFLTRVGAFVRSVEHAQYGTRGCTCEECDERVAAFFAH